MGRMQNGWGGFFALSASFACAVIVMVVYLFTNQNISMQGISQTVLGAAFTNPQPIINGVICTIAVTGTIALELFLDIFVESGLTDVSDQGERLLMILIIIIPGTLMLKFAYTPHMPFIFCCLHTIQAIGSAAPIFSLCCKLVPAFFTFRKMFISYTFWALAGTFTVIGFHRPLNSWANLSIFFCVSISLGLLSHMMFCWWKEVLSKAQNVSQKNTNVKTRDLMNDDEICCLAYLLCTLATIVLVPAITGAIRLYNWEAWNQMDLCVNIYSLGIFSVLSGVIPGRLRQHSARVLIEQKIKSRNATVRYISHEIRSPLNIVQNGVRLIIENLRGRCDAQVLQDLEDVQHASSAATCVIDDLLNFEKIESGSFELETKFEYASSLGQMATRCQPLAEQKGIKLTVHNHINDEGCDKVCCILIDSFKMEQVVRNLIVNAIKFTPENGRITVHLRCEPFQDVAISFRNGFMEGDGTNSRQSVLFYAYSIIQNLTQCFQSVKVYAEAEERKSKRTEKWAGNIRVDISDTGAGISMSQFNNIFGEFAQFNANRLQGGGGSGLGLWICKEIIKQHKGIISFTSDGIGMGTTFTIQLRCCLKNRFELSPSQEVVDQLPYVTLHHDIEEISKGRSKSRFITSIRSAHSLYESRPPVEKLLVEAPDQFVCVPIGTISVLIVDDIALNRKMMKKMITHIVQMQSPDNKLPDFELFEADDGSTALELVHGSAEKFDLILIDNIMNKMHGPQAVKQMRENGCKALIVGVTGNVTPADIADFKEQGADDVIKKPVSMEILTHTILKFNCA